MASGYSNGAGGAITDWAEMDAWLRSAEAVPVVVEGERALDEARTTSGLDRLTVVTGALVRVRELLPRPLRVAFARLIPEAHRRLRAGAAAEASRLLEAPLRELVDRIRAARARRSDRRRAA